MNRVFKVVSSSCAPELVGGKYKVVTGLTKLVCLEGTPGNLRVDFPPTGEEKQLVTASGTVLVLDEPAVPHDGKDDSDKPNPGLLFNGCAGALKAVCGVLEGGAKKYAADSWQNVPDGIKRYWAAAERHKQEINLHGLNAVNPDFGLLHLDHLITDLLFVRELMIKEANANAANT